MYTGRAKVTDLLTGKVWIGKIVGWELEEEWDAFDFEWKRWYGDGQGYDIHRQWRGVDRYKFEPLEGAADG